QNVIGSDEDMVHAFGHELANDSPPPLQDAGGEAARRMRAVEQILMRDRPVAVDVEIGLVLHFPRMQRTAELDLGRPCTSELERVRSGTRGRSCCAARPVWRGTLAVQVQLQTLA